MVFLRSFLSTLFLITFSCVANSQVFGLQFSVLCPLQSAQYNMVLHLFPPILRSKLSGPFHPLQLALQTEKEPDWEEPPPRPWDH